MATAFRRASPEALHTRAAYLNGLALAALGAVFFSAKAVVAKLLYRHGVDVVTLIALRMLLSAPVFMLVAAWSWNRAPRLDRRDLIRIMALGLLGYYASSMFDFMGLQYITAGLERLILFLTPTFVLLLGVLIYRRRVSARQWLSMAFAYAGIVLVFWHDVSLGGDAVVLGSSFVLAAALLYAIYLLLSGELIRRVGTLRLVSLAMTVSAVASLAQYLLFYPLPQLFQQAAPVWGLSLVNATLCTVLPVFLTMFGVARVGAGNASQAGMIGPVSTLVLAWWLLSEPITGLQVAGTALVMSGVFLLSTARLARAGVEPAPVP
ncbi:MAG: DMT family transporter [Panacagrimonas sp.]